MDLAGLAEKYLRGQVYVRKTVHDELGGQEQVGISTPLATPAVLLFSNPQGTDYGHKSEWKVADGFYHFTGEGRFGDMVMERGNRAVREHHKDGKVLMLFEGVRGFPGLYRFGGFMHCVDYYEKNTDSLGNKRRVFIFRLVSIDNLIIRKLPDQSEAATEFLDMRPTVLALVNQGADAKLEVPAIGGFFEPRHPGGLDSEEGSLAERPESTQIPLMNSSGHEKPVLHRGSVRRLLQDNSRDYYEATVRFLRRYVFQRANGFCEACGSPAPFRAKNGSPYLEIHSVRFDADYGLEHPNALLAVCPTCHREAHLGVDGMLIAVRFDRVAADIENALDRNTLKLVTAAIIKDNQGRILVGQRATGELAGHWEFPGGQVKPGETLKDCLIRELREELSLDVHSIAPFKKIDHNYDSFFLRMFCFTCQATGDLILHDHTQVKWMEPKDLASLKWLPADVGIVGELGRG